MYYVSKVYQMENKDKVVDILLGNKHPKYKGVKGVNGIIYDLEKKRFYELKNNLVLKFDEEGEDFIGMFSLLKKIGFTISDNVLHRFLNMISETEKQTNE